MPPENQPNRPTIHSVIRNADALRKRQLDSADRPRHRAEDGAERGQEHQPVTAK